MLFIFCQLSESPHLMGMRRILKMSDVNLKEDDQSEI
jgi:hypothetical protein